MPSVLREFIENGGIGVKNMAERVARIPGTPPARTQTRIERIQHKVVPAGVGQRQPSRVAQLCQLRLGDIPAIKEVYDEIAAENWEVERAKDLMWQELHAPVDQEKEVMVRAIDVITKIIYRVGQSIEPEVAYGRLVGDYPSEVILIAAKRLRESLSAGYDLSDTRKFLQDKKWDKSKIKCQIALIALIKGEIPIETNN